MDYLDALQMDTVLHKGNALVQQLGINEVYDMYTVTI